MMKICAIILVCVCACGYIYADKSMQDIIAQEVLFADKEETDETIKLLDEVLMNEPADFSGLAQKSQILYESGKLQEASEICSRAIEMGVTGEDKLKFYMINSAALEELGENDKALNCINEGIDEFPVNSSLYYKKGVVLIKKGMYPQAVNILQEAVSLDPMHTKAHQALASLNKENPAISLMTSLRSFILQINKEQESASKDVMSDLIKEIKKKDTSTKMDEVMTFLNNIDETEDNFSLINYNLKLKDRAISINNSYTNEEIVKEKLNILCTSLSQGMRWGKGFYWSYYAPYYVELYDNNFVDIVAHFLLAKNGDTASAKWLDKNTDRVFLFYLWNEGYDW